MKTILFFYQDSLLHQSVVEAYVCLPNSVDETIKQKLKCMSREVKEGYYSYPRIEIVDKINIKIINF